jgi:hypothetical protein
MKEISSRDWDLLRDAALGKISKSELSKILSPIDAAAFRELLASLLMDEDTREYNGKYCLVFWYLPTKATKEDKASLFREFLLEQGHNEHEEIVNAFQTSLNDNPENLNALKLAFNKLPSYLQRDDMKYPYLRKIIYAIGAQPEPFNLATLKELVNSEDDKIKELVLHQIEKRQRLGRWEVANKVSGNNNE